MTEKIDPAVKNVKTTIIRMPYIFRRREEYMNMIRREMEEIFLTIQMESPQMKITIPEMKSRVDTY